MGMYFPCFRGVQRAASNTIPLNADPAILIVLTPSTDMEGLSSPASSICGSVDAEMDAALQQILMDEYGPKQYGSSTDVF